MPLCKHHSTARTVRGWRRTQSWEASILVGQGVCSREAHSEGKCWRLHQLCCQGCGWSSWSLCPPRQKYLPPVPHTAKSMITWSVPGTFFLFLPPGASEESARKVSKASAYALDSCVVKDVGGRHGRCAPPDKNTSPLCRTQPSQSSHGQFLVLSSCFFRRGRRKKVPGRFQRQAHTLSTVLE